MFISGVMGGLFVVPLVARAQFARAASFAYVANDSAETISAFVTGVLNDIPGSPYSTGDGPFSIAIF